MLLGREPGKNECWVHAHARRTCTHHGLLWMTTTYAAEWDAECATNAGISTKRIVEGHTRGMLTHIRPSLGMYRSDAATEGISRHPRNRSQAERRGHWAARGHRRYKVLAEAASLPAVRLLLGALLRVAVADHGRCGYGRTHGVD